MQNQIELKSERLLLRGICMDDAQAIFNYRQDEITNQYQGWIPKHLDDVYTFIKKLPAEINLIDTWFQLAIINLDSDELIGDVGIHFMGDENSQAEIGCTMAKDHHGKGYATEALKRVIDYLFHDLDKHRIIASIDPGNLPSIALVERLGFRKEAHFRESLLINGQWVDDIIYAILKSEW